MEGKLYWIGLKLLSVDPGGFIPQSDSDRGGSGVWADEGYALLTAGRYFRIRLLNELIDQRA